MEVTLELSKTGTPNISFVLPLYLKMQSHLETIVNDVELTFGLSHAAQKGLDKLNKYYTIAQDHHAYVVGTSGLTFRDRTPQLMFIL